jgi:hypothetical protein
MASSGNGQDDDSLNYIFLDVISCGLGGAILLGVILAVPKVPKPTAVASAPYLAVRTNVTASDGKTPDVDALPNIWIQAPGQVDGFDMPLELFDLKTGRVRSTASIPQLADVGITNSQIFLTGYFRHAEGEAELIPIAKEVKSAYYELILTQPAAGQWKFRIRYQNRRNIADYVGEQAPPICVALSVHLGSAATATNPDRDKPISFGAFSSQVSVTIPGASVKHVHR